MKFLVDVNLSSKWLSFLRDMKHEAVYWTDIGNATDTDDLIMNHARLNDLIILTCDLDFSAMLAASGDVKPSIAQLRPGRLRPELLMGRLEIALRIHETALRTGTLLTIDFGASRTQHLPLVDNKSDLEI
jgi:predicted nuclease of predicted toxin-antitoxin system